ncbi:MAG: membrane dipeptidase [Bacteroidaceae bacterium]|nr:membrane dipeptidase [Bacteroidaceae bacterium]
MKPVIGITGNFGDNTCQLSKAYYQSVLEAGGSPLIIPPYEDSESLQSALSQVDAVILSGGGDLNPLLIGEEPIPQLHSVNAERDQAELNLISQALQLQIPMLGICRGIQMLVAAMGGELYQDLPAQYHDAPLVKHSQDLARHCASHTVDVEPGTVLNSIFCARTSSEPLRLNVNSFHHQAVKAPGPQLRVSARSADGVIEAVESTTYKSILGVQWHPEAFITGGDRSMLPVFQWLVDEASNYAEAKRIHNRILTLDSHCDTPMKFGTDEERLVTLPRMRQGRLDASIMVAYIPQGERTPEAYASATGKADGILCKIQDIISRHPDEVSLARTPEDLYRIKGEERRAIMMGIENGYAIGNDLDRIKYFRDRGVVYMTLCHNGDNDICDSARKSNGEHGGVSAFGEQVIHEMNSVGMMVDLSHAAESSFYDALDISRTPVVCSHSSCRSLCDHPRNLTDGQMKALAAKGGVMQVTLYDGFLCADGGATISHAIEHLQHAIDIMGVENVGIGTDFDGDGGITGLAHAGELINFTRALLRRRFSEDDLRGIWGENFLRVMRTVQNQAHEA